MTTITHNSDLAENKMKCVILQPSYIPWRGFFHQIQKADVFVFYDDVQYTRRSWRNRNRLKTPQGPKWLTIPVHSRGCQVDGMLIREARISWEQPWAKAHLRTLLQSYRKAPFLNTYRPLLEDFYGRRPHRLADFTIDLTIALAGELGICGKTYLRSSELHADGDATTRLIKICRSLGADHYISGPAARCYLKEEKLQEAGIRLEYMAYVYPEYPQLHPPFDPHVTVLDLLFMTGPQAGEYIWGLDSSAAFEPLGHRANATS